MADDGKTESAWREGLPEDLKNSAELRTFKSVSDLAKSYVSSSKMLSQRFEGVGKDDTFESFSEKAGKFLKIPEISEYKGTKHEEVNKLAHKLKIHPEFQLKPFLKEYDQTKGQLLEAEKLEKLKVWEEESKKLTKEMKDKDEVLGRAFKRLEVQREGFEKEMGDLAKHPGVLKLLLKLGEVQEGKASDPKTTGAGGGEGVLGVIQKTAFVKEHTSNFSSPLYDSKHPNHLATKTKVESYLKELSEYERKHKVKLMAPE